MLVRSSCGSLLSPCSLAGAPSVWARVTRVALAPAGSLGGELRVGGLAGVAVLWMLSPWRALGSVLESAGHSGNCGIDPAGPRARLEG